MAKPIDVNSYIAHSASEARPILEELRMIIKSAVPGVEEGISYNVPFYKYCGALAGFAVYKNHVSFGFALGALQDEDRRTLGEQGYVTGKETLQIKFGQKVPAAAIRQILIANAKMNEDKKADK
jgi:uncharacterized protein